MNMRTIGIGIVAVALILAISMTASADPDPQSPTSAVFVDETRYAPTAVDTAAEGGTITNVEITGDVLTSKWHGYYGNVSGVLTSAIPAQSSPYTLDLTYPTFSHTLGV